MFGRRHTPSTRPYLLIFRIVGPRISSSLVLSRILCSGSFNLEKTSQSHEFRRKRRHLMVQNSISLHENATSHTTVVMDLLRRCNMRFWNIHRTYPIWVHVITISSPNWKTHCEGPGTAQEISLSVLYGGQYGTLTKMDALAVYDAFQTFGTGDK